VARHSKLLNCRIEVENCARSGTFPHRGQSSKSAFLVLLSSGRPAYADRAFQLAVSDNRQPTTHSDIGRSPSLDDIGQRRSRCFERSVARLSTFGCSDRFANGRPRSLSKYPLHALMRDQVPIWIAYGDTDAYRQIF